MKTEHQLLLLGDVLKLGGSRVFLEGHDVRRDKKRKKKITEDVVVFMKDDEKHYRYLRTQEEDSSAGPKPPAEITVDSFFKIPASEYKAVRSEGFRLDTNVNHALLKKAKFPVQKEQLSLFANSDEVTQTPPGGCVD